jgi:hypothetical protein
MDEQRIARIIELESQASKPESAASAVRWETARLYWEEYRAGTPQKDIAEKVGKSRPHVCYMVKCWEICGRKITGDLPDFQTIYRSPEVRGQSADISDPGRGSSEPRERKADDIHSQTAQFTGLAPAIAAGMPALSERERRAVRHAIRTIEIAFTA